jgi:hypothetical protein
MDIIDSRPEIRNSKVLYLILGVLLIPVLNSVDSLAGGLFKMLGLSVISRFALSLAFQSAIILGLLGILVWIITNWHVEKPPKTALTLKRFRTYGILFLIILVAGKIVSFFVLVNFSIELELLETSQRSDILRDSAYLHAASTILSTVREIVLFAMYFVIVFKNS